MQRSLMPLGFRKSPLTMQRAIIASWYARNADRRAPVTLPREPYLPKIKPWGPRRGAAATAESITHRPPRRASTATEFEPND